ncbi:hypothetical protein SAMN05216357_11081 [Porphyromonadaceae bacterium KH3CP3RA]|nr:hypothetical protein SAMN05216357_11081 [Porphyromonadaceae bacterium KH3CP3RA]
MDINFDNHIEALDSAILIDRKHGDCFQLKHITEGVFFAQHTTKNIQGILGLSKISKGLSIMRYRILEVKN